MWRNLFAGLSLSAALSAGAAVPTQGLFIYGQAAPVGTPLESRYARLSFELESCGDFVRTSWYDAAHTLLAADELEAPGHRLLRYHFWRTNVDDWAVVTRHGAVLQILHHASGKSRSAELAADDSVTVGPMLVLAAERELHQLNDGLQLKFRYAVPEQFDAYEFTVGRALTASDQPRAVQILPASWILRRFVHPLDLYFDRDGLLTRLHGRVLPVMGTAAHEEPIEVEAQIVRRETHTCSAQARLEDAQLHLKAAR